jgi:hypothetical protein
MAEPRSRRCLSDLPLVGCVRTGCLIERRREPVSTPVTCFDESRLFRIVREHAPQFLMQDASASSLTMVSLQTEAKRCSLETGSPACVTNTLLPIRARISGGSMAIGQCVRQASMVGGFVLAGFGPAGSPTTAQAQVMAAHQHDAPGDQKVSSDLVRVVRASTARFFDVEAAEAEDYHLLFGCVSGPDFGAMECIS